MEIRAATLADAAGVAEVHVASWRETYPGIIPQTYIDRLDIVAREAHWGSVITRGDFVLLATNAKGVAGFVATGPFRASVETMAGEVYAIYLRAQYQKQGIGRALFKTARNHLATRNLLPFGVWVLKDNPACRFYQAMGGTVCKEKIITLDNVDLPEILFRFE
jgi:GNAT superfamily N-acetyltransferase